MKLYGVSRGSLTNARAISSTLCSRWVHKSERASRQPSTKSREHPWRASKLYGWRESRFVFQLFSWFYSGILSLISSTKKLLQSEIEEWNRRNCKIIFTRQSKGLCFHLNSIKKKEKARSHSSNLVFIATTGEVDMWISEELNKVDYRGGGKKFLIRGLSHFPSLLSHDRSRPSRCSAFDNIVLRRRAIFDTKTTQHGQRIQR